MDGLVVVELTALDDPPEVKEINPIHGTGAQQAGYDRPIVGGVSSYAWAVAPVVELLGEGWLGFGWSEFSLRRPVFAGDRLRATATLTDRGTCGFELTNDDGVVTVQGRAGLGFGPWPHEWQLPSDRTPQPPADPPPLVLPEDAPGEGDLLAMAAQLSIADAAAWATNRMGDRHPRYQQGDQGFVHPSWIVGQGVSTIRHSMRGPEVGIHLGSRVQHLAPMRPPLDLVIAGRWTRHEHRKERWYSARDYVFQNPDGQELAYVHEDAILLPPFAPT